MWRKKTGIFFLALFCLLLPMKEAGAAGDRTEILWKEGSQDGMLIWGGLASSGTVRKIRAVSAAYDFENDRKIAEAVKAMDSRISVESMGITTENVAEIVNRVCNTNPDLFYLKKWEYSYYPSTGRVTDLMFTYTGTEEEILGQKEEIQKVMEEAEKALEPENMSDEEIALALHDYLAGHVEYAYEDYLADMVSPSAYSIYGALAEGEAVCQGYAMAYGYLLDSYGIPNRIVVSERADHAWNLVKIGGFWYHADVTRDDPPWDNLGQALHSTFLIGTKSLLLLEPQRGDFAIVEKEADSFEYVSDARFEDKFWRDSNGVMHYYEGYWYYAERMCPEIVKYSYDIEQKLSIAQLDKLWPSGEPDEYWEGNFSRIARMGNMLYYSAPTEVYSLEPGSGKTARIFSLEPGGDFIYGLGVREGKLAYALRAEPDADEPEEVRALELSDYKEQDTGTEETVNIPVKPRPQIAKQGLKKGDLISSGKMRYQILSLKGKIGTVSLKAVETKGIKSVKIPAQISQNSYRFRVASIADHAFKNCRKLRTAVIGREVIVIGKNAFRGCRKLTRVTVKTTRLKRVGKNAFKGVSTKIMVKVPKKRKKAYFRLLKSKGIKKLR